MTHLLTAQFNRLLPVQAYQVTQGTDI